MGIFLQTAAKSPKLPENYRTLDDIFLFIYLNDSFTSDYKMCVCVCGWEGVPILFWCQKYAAFFQRTGTVFCLWDFIILNSRFMLFMSPTRLQLKMIYLLGFCYWESKRMFGIYLFDNGIYQSFAYVTWRDMLLIKIKRCLTTLIPSHI